MSKILKDLLSTEARRWRRGFSDRVHGGTTRFALTVLVSGYALALIVGMGFYVDDVLRWIRPVFSADEVRAMIVVLGGLYLALRIVTHRPSLLSFRPYLVLPIPKWILAHCNVVGSILNVQNILVIAFFAPVIIDQTNGSAQAASVVAQSLLLRRIGLTVAVTAAVVVGLAVSVGEKASSTLNEIVIAFAGVIQVSTAHPAASVMLLCAATLVSYGMAYSKSASQFRLDAPRRRRGRARPSPERRGGRWSTWSGPVSRLVRLELTMIARNERPRANLIGVGGFVLFGALTVLNPALQGNTLFVASSGLVASAAFIFTHGSLMFSWDTNFLDGVFSKPVHVQHLVQAKFIVLLSSVAVVGSMLGGLLAIVSSAGTAVMASICIYNAGVSCPLMLWDAVRHARSVDLSGRVMFNYEESGALWVAVVILVPLATIPLLAVSVMTWTSIVATPGVVGLLTAPWWQRKLADELRSRQSAFTEAAHA